MIQVNSWVHTSLLLSFLFLILSIVERTQNRTHTPPRMEQMVVMTTANVNIGPRPSRGLFSSPSGRKNRVRLDLRTMCLNWFNYTLTYWKSDNNQKGLSLNKDEKIVYDFFCQESWTLVTWHFDLQTHKCSSVPSMQSSLPSHTAALSMHIPFWHLYWPYCGHAEMETIFRRNKKRTTLAERNSLPPPFLVQNGSLVHTKTTLQPDGLRFFVKKGLRQDFAICPVLKFNQEMTRGNSRFKEWIQRNLQLLVSITRWNERKLKQSKEM